jgi:hypothetical protein
VRTLVRQRGRYPEPMADGEDAEGERPVEVDAEVEAEAEEIARPRPKVRRKTATGTLFAAALLGLQEALEGKPPREEPAVVEQTVGGDGDPVDVVIDPDDPRLTVAFVKPWLLRS